jgi:hypothetical protein
VVAKSAAGKHCGRFDSALPFWLRDTHGLDHLAAPAITSGYRAPMNRAPTGVVNRIISFVKLQELEKDVTKSEPDTF